MSDEKPTTNKDLDVLLTNLDKQLLSRLLDALTEEQGIEIKEKKE